MFNVGLLFVYRNFIAATFAWKRTTEHWTLCPIPFWYYSKNIKCLLRYSITCRSHFSCRTEIRFIHLRANKGHKHIQKDVDRHVSCEVKTYMCRKLCRNENAYLFLKSIELVKQYFAQNPAQNTNFIQVHTNVNTVE